MYIDCLDTKLIPALTECVEKYSEWWSFKVFSPFVEYVHGRLPSYFRPEELINLLLNDAEKNYSFDPGNSKIILVDEYLQKCFNTTVIFVSDLYTLCLSHINILDDPAKVLLIKNKHIAADLWIDTPYDILYKDSSSKFWLPPLYNDIMCKNTKMTYKWNELCFLITNFITTKNPYFTPFGVGSFLINSGTAFSNEMKFKYFHKSQIPDIIKQIIKYLGKQSNILTLCPELYQTNDDIETAKFLEEIMFGNNRLMPHSNSYINL